MSPDRGRRGNRPRQRPESRRATRAGERHEVTCGPVAHGGHVVARAEDGVVLFVRHALPDERVVALVTEGRVGDRFLRADAVEVLEASPHRVPAPCPYAGPGACGGCDFQHVDPDHQRDLKTTVVREQLRRLAGLESDVVVERVDPVLGWRTRMQYVDLPDGRRGLRQHRSHDVVPVETCLIDAGTSPEGDEPVQEHVGPHVFTVEPDGFWQPHAAAPQLLVDTVRELAAPRPSESALDLYSGVGLFSAFLADDVGPTGWVTAVEGDAAASSHAADNSAAEAVHGDVQRWLEGPEAPEHVDLVVLDPPRTGAKQRVVEAITRRTPRAVVYVACDPAALARDVALFAERGYRLSALRSFDLFPMTHHVECVALLEPTT